MLCVQERTVMTWNLGSGMFTHFLFSHIFSSFCFHTFSPKVSLSQILNSHYFPLIFTHLHLFSLPIKHLSSSFNYAAHYVHCRRSQNLQKSSNKAPKQKPD